MGTWGVIGFANDEAGDWSNEFKNADLETGLKLIRDALNFDGADSEGIQVLAEMLAVAAAEMVARINGHTVPPPPDTRLLGDEDEVVYEDGDDERAMEWIARTHPASDPDLTDLARHAVARVTGPGSDLAEAWVESEDNGTGWRSYMAEVAAKLAET